MFRKLTIAATAVVALSAVALAPTSASAWGHGGWGGHGFGWGPRVGIGVGLVAGAVATNACLRRVVVDTPYGPQVRFANVCY